MTTQSTSANRKALLTHLTVAGGAALISTTANAQIMKVLVNQEVGYAPGDLTSFTSALPGTNQFKLIRGSVTTSSGAIAHAISFKPIGT